jgi:hypothetical protein
MYKNPKDEIFSKYAEAPENQYYDAYKEDIALVTFYFDGSTAFQYTRAPRMTWTDFMSQVGGLMGLCLGFRYMARLYSKLIECNSLFAVSPPSSKSSTGLDSDCSAIRSADVGLPPNY